MFNSKANKNSLYNYGSYLLQNRMSWKDVIIILETEHCLYFGHMINVLLIEFI